MGSVGLDEENYLGGSPVRKRPVSSDRSATDFGETLLHDLERRVDTDIPDG